MAWTLLVFISALFTPALSWGQSLAGLEGTYAVCQREAELALTREQFRSLNQTQLRELEAQVNSFRDDRPLAYDCGCPVVAPANLNDFIGETQGVLRQLLESDASLTDDEAARVAAVVRACEQREERAFTAARQLSRAVYSLSVPAGYSLVQRFSAANGLKGYVLRDGSGEMHVVFAGSQDAEDWRGNINGLGAAQYRSAINSGIMEPLVAHVLAGKKVSCSGHSLGGGLAQSFCARLMLQARAERPGFGEVQSENLVRVTTFSALGGREMMGDPVSLNSTWFAAANTHFVNRGDPVPSFSPPVCGYIRTLAGGELPPFEAHDLGSIERRSAEGWRNSVRTRWRSAGRALRDRWDTAMDGLGKLLGRFF